MRAKLITLMIAFVIILAGMGLSASVKHKTIIIEEDSVEELPQKPAKTIESYYPIVKDSMWEYQMKSQPTDELTVSVDFIKENVFQLRYRKDDDTYIKVFVQEDDALYEVATIEDDFIKNDYTLLRQYKEVVLKLPLDVGNSWVLKDGAIRTITAVDKPLVTPKGDLKVIEVTTNHKDYELVQSYAEKIGLVGYYYEAATGKESVLIEDYLMNQPIKTYINVYYPNIVKGKLEFLKQEISIMTNEEPKHFLTDILSLKRDEDTIQSLPLDAEIMGIYAEEEEKTVYVDLSKSYKSSDYTREEEKLALQSVVKTIGHYYKMDYVTITVNGEGYRERIRVR